MAESKIETVRGVYAAFNGGEPERAFDLAHPDFEMDWSNSIGPLKGVYRGREQILELWRGFLSAWSEVSWEPQEVIEVDEDHLVIENHVRMRGQGSGIEIDATGYQLWTFRDGLGESVKLFQTRDEALAAAES